MSGTPRILVWDIENSPALGWFWGSTYNTNIVEVKQASRTMSFAAKWLGEKKVEYRSDFHDGHEEMIGRAWDLLDEADCLVSYNGKSHDTPHVSTEILLAKGTPPSPFIECDLYRVVKSRLKFQKNRLDFVAGELEIGKKVEHEGFGLWLKCMAGDPKAWARFKAYNIGDIDLTESLLDKLLPWIPPSMYPNMNLLSTQDVCPKCGLENFEKRGTTKPVGVAIYQQYVCKDCGTWFRGKTALATVNMRSVA
jgi:predicted RNA-binding Zn-ribbon protein involved in translation (DUF1610 family)